MIQLLFIRLPQQRTLFYGVFFIIHLRILFGLHHPGIGFIPHLKCSKVVVAEQSGYAEIAMQ